MSACRRSCWPDPAVPDRGALHGGRRPRRLAPAGAITGTLLHELAHLRWRGHSQRFWALHRRLLDPATLPELPPEPKRPELRLLSPTAVPRDPTERERRRAADYMRKVIRNLARMAPNSGRNSALNGAAWTLGHWVAAGALEQSDVEEALYGAAEQNGLVADDGARQCWATIRSGLSAGLRQAP